MKTKQENTVLMIRSPMLCIRNNEILIITFVNIFIWFLKTLETLSTFLKSSFVYRQKHNLKKANKSFFFPPNFNFQMELRNKSELWV